MRTNRRRGLLAIILGSLLGLVSLTGCMSFDGQMTLYKNGRWESKYDLIVAPEALTLAGGVAGLDASMEQQLGTAGVKHQQGGATYSWERVRSDDNSIVYRISMSGDDLESLNSAMQGGASAQVVRSADGTESIRLTFSTSSLGTFDQAKFTLKAGKILDSNADRVSGGTAEWYDISYGTAQATVTGANRGPAAGLLLALGGLGLLSAVGAAVLAAEKKRRRTMPISPGYCSSCGGQLLPGATFCMKCGTRVDGNRSQAQGGE